jgi:anti-sigma B factor antagonist
MMGTAGDRASYSATVTHTEQMTVLAIVGELDMATVGQFVTDVRGQMGRGRVLLDLSGLSFMDSAGMRALDGVLRDAERDGFDLVIGSEMQDAVRRLLDLTGILAGLPLVSVAGAEEAK